MTSTHALKLGRGAGVLGILSALVGTACAQTVPTTPPSQGPRTEKTPNAETPPGGIARGVVRPPKRVDPGIIEPPPANVKPTMPVIKPPSIAR